MWPTVSELFAETFHATLQSFVWRRHTWFGTQNQQKHLEITFSIKALSFHSRTSIRAHKHIFSYLKWLCGWKSRGEAFSQRDSIPILSHTLWKLGSSNCCSLEMKHAMGLETVKRFVFSLSSTICKWEFVNPRYFDFTIWWSHCENHLSIDGYALITRNQTVYIPQQIIDTKQWLVISKQRKRNTFRHFMIKSWSTDQA